MSPDSEFRNTCSQFLIMLINQKIKLEWIGDRATAADVVSMVSSVVSALQVEDPGRASMFN